MSLKNCIPGMVERGEIDKARAARMGKLFDQLERHYRMSMAPAAATAQASESTLVQLAAEAALKERQTLLSVAARDRAVTDLTRYKGKSTYAGIRAMLDDDLRAPYENITRRTEQVEFQAQARISDFIQRHRRTFLGTASDKAGMLDIVREMHGESTGNPRAATFAGAIADVFEDLRLRFNAAGGAIGKLDNYFPHRWNTAKVRALGQGEAGYQAFRALMLPELDVARMRDPISGGELTAERLEEAMHATYENIRTGGLTGEATGGFSAGGMLANQRAETRFLHFKDAEAWLRVHDQIGEGDPFSAIMHHIRGMADDIATMERLGPNPDATMRYLLDHADRGAAQADTKVSRAATGTSGDRWATEQLWRFKRGDLNTPVESESWLAGPPVAVTKTLQGTRNLITASMLGSAPLSAISDTYTQIMARRMAGLPTSKVMMSYLRQLNPLSAADRDLAVRLELGARNASHTLLAASRYFGSLADKPGWTAVVADDVLRLSGLNALTEGGQRALGVDFLGELGANRDVAFAALDKNLRGKMEEAGLTSAMWDTIRKAEPEKARGVAFVSPPNVRAADREAGERLMDLVLRTTAMAVPEATATTRALFTGGARPGTWAREVLTNSVQFRSFSVGLMMQQAQQIALLPNLSNKLAYGARFFIGLTMFGALTIQLRELAKGRDPVPMDQKDFWEKAALQGGGIGIIGDLLNSATDSRIGSIGEFFGGPMVSVGSDVKSAVTSALPHTSPNGDVRPGNPGAAIVKLGKRYTPGTNLWYWRAAFEHMVMDQLAHEIDPDYSQREERVRQWAAQNGQGLWWEPGNPTPTRAPNASNALGAENRAP